MHKYLEVTCTTSWVGYDFGFIATNVRLVLQVDTGNAEFSFDGIDVAGELGPKGTQPFDVELSVGGQSQVFVKSGAGGEKISVYAND